MNGDQYKVGDQVVLGEHDGTGSAKDWNSAMGKYVGRIATITRVGSIWQGFQYYRVDVDGSTWQWRGFNMKPINVANLSPTSGSGCKCTKCHEFYPYADHVEGFICWGCRH